jgi:predicted nucleic acid-binding protein
VKYLYDADAVIDYFVDLPGARSTFHTLLADGIAVSGITLIELYTGVYGSKNPKVAEQEVQAGLGVATVLRLNQRIIRRTARLRHEMITRRLSIRRRAYDVIVAASALTYGLTLVTSNTADYRQVSGLTTLDPRTGQMLTH